MTFVPMGAGTNALSPLRDTRTITIMESDVLAAMSMMKKAATRIPASASIFS